MLLRPFLYDTTACASYLFGCGTHSKLAVVDPHLDLVEDYLATATALGAPIVAAFETHLQADHVSGLPALVERSGATAYLPAGPASSSSTSRSQTETQLSSATRSSLRSPPPVTRPPTTPTRSPIGGAGPTSRGSSSAATRF